MADFERAAHTATESAAPDAAAPAEPQPAPRATNGLTREQATDRAEPQQEQAATVVVGTTSADGYYQWDGSAWQPVVQAPAYLQPMEQPAAAPMGLDRAVEYVRRAYEDPGRRQALFWYQGEGGGVIADPLEMDLERTQSDYVQRASVPRADRTWQWEFTFFLRLSSLSSNGEEQGFGKTREAFLCASASEAWIELSADEYQRVGAAGA